MPLPQTPYRLIQLVLTSNRLIKIHLISLLLYKTLIKVSLAFAIPYMFQMLPISSIAVQQRRRVMALTPL
jgi:hypothetical protein